MLNPKKLFAILFIGGIGGFLAVVIISPIFIKYNFLGNAVIFDKFFGQPQTVRTKIEEKPTITPQLNYFSEAINKIQPSVVAIQFFSGGALIRYGSGIILTQDGLIATLNSIVPANTSVIQVTNAGKIYKAKVVSRDYNKNIALISITVENNLQVIRLKSELPGLGQKLLVFAETVSFSEDKPLVVEALVSQTDEKNSQFKLSLIYEPGFYGAVVADNDGNALGLLDFRNQKPVVILSKTVSDALNTHLQK